MNLRFAPYALGFLLWALPAVAEPVSQPHVTLELVAAETGFQAGRPVDVGIRFELEPGWHLYWRNPGDSGREPHVKWELPPGFSAGELRWPTPSRLPFGRLVNYGYERRLLLATTLQVPAELPPESRKEPLPLLAKADWLVCAAECIPGKLDLRLALPVIPAEAGAPPPSPTADLFLRTAESLPKPMPSTWSLKGYSEGDAFFLHLGSLSPVGEILFFPYRPRILQNAAPQELVRQGDALELKLARSDQSPDRVDRLSGVLLTGGVGYEIDVSVTPRHRDWMPWILAGAGVLLAVLILLWTNTRRRSRPPPKPPEKKNALRYYFPLWQQ